jgi:carboxyl-terminal processing protease
MRVLAIDGLPVAAAADARLGPAVRRPAPPAARAWALLAALAGRHDRPRTLRVRDAAGRTREVAPDRPGEHPVGDGDDRAPVEFYRVAGASGAASPAGAYGYVRLTALGDPRSVAAFDSALDALRDTRGLVLDLRETAGGGNTGVAEPILGRLITRAQGYQRVVPRAGSPSLRVVHPRGPWAYTRPVVVLVGRWTGSMGEGMAVGLDALRGGGGRRARGRRPRAIVVGTRMAGLAGAVEDVTLPCTGVRVGLPTARLLHVDGTPRERWAPPVVVDLAAAERTGAPRSGLPADASEDRDVVLARGLAVLRARSAR